MSRIVLFPAGLLGGLILLGLTACSGDDDAETVGEVVEAVSEAVAAADSEIIVDLTEENFASLLTVGDVQRVLLASTLLETNVMDLKALAQGVNAEQVALIDSAFVMRFDREDLMAGMTLGVVDFTSPAAALDHFEQAKGTTVPGTLADMDSPIGDVSAKLQFDSMEIGSIVLFIKGGKAVQIHTTQAEGQLPLIDLSGLEALARVAEARLR